MAGGRETFPVKEAPYVLCDIPHLGKRQVWLPLLLFLPFLVGFLLEGGQSLLNKHSKLTSGFTILAGSALQTGSHFHLRGSASPP